MNNLKKHLLSTQNHNPYLFNIIFWGCSFVGLLFLFSDENQPTKIDVVYTISFITTLVIPVSIAIYYLIPAFLKKEKLFLFLLLFCSTIFVFSQFNSWFFNSLIDVVFPDYYFVSYHSNTKLILIFGAFLVTSTLLKLAEDWMFFNKQENKKLQLKNSLIQTQLSSLRAQINPHFLFNSLNVIYSLAVQNKPSTTEAIVQLSDILRTAIYDENTVEIPLNKELILLKKYIEFQKFRFQNTIPIVFNQQITKTDTVIYPMLLLPILENSYKHGTNASIKNRFIHIDVVASKKEFFFCVKNAFLEDTPTQNSSLQGVGLKNLQQNLILMYPKNHQFSIIKKNGIFTVTLRIFNEN